MTGQISAIIVDDEQDGREVLLHMLSSFPSGISVIGQAENAEQACRMIGELRPDLVFLDIQMAGGSGFSVLQQFGAVPFEVIFVTSFQQYAISAIRFSALDYLLKPVDIDELKVATEKAHLRIREKRSSEAQVLGLLESLDRQQNLKKVAVHVKDAVVIVDQSQLVYILAQGSYCRIFLEDGQEHIMPVLLKEFEGYFGKYSSMVRINKQVMVNADFIGSYTKGEPCMVTLRNGAAFEVPRRKKQEILDRLGARVNTRAV